MNRDASEVLATVAPFDTLSGPELDALIDAGTIEQHRAGSVVIDAFVDPTVEVFVVLDGEIELWNDPERVLEQADERLGRGGVFGFSAMLTERSVGPRAVSVAVSRVLRLPAVVAWPVFSSRSGASFLADQVSAANRSDASPPAYSLVDDLIVSAPLVVSPSQPAGEVARLMTERKLAYAAVDVAAQHPGALPGLVTDALLRRRLLVDGVPRDAPASSVMIHPAPTASLGDSAAEVLISMLDLDVDLLLVLDRAGAVRGAVTARDMVVSPTTAGASLHEQIRRSRDVPELVARAHRVPGMLHGVLARGLASPKVIAVHSAIVDSIVRRALALVLARHPRLDADAFTWLSLGSNGRREALPGSDIDAAVVFDDAVGADERATYRQVFAQVNEILLEAGLRVDRNGATPARAQFARTDSEWRAAATGWLADPVPDQGAIMTSLLVDARPIHGDPALPVVARVFGDLRAHPGTLRLLLQHSLAARARLRTVRDVIARHDVVDVKAHALLPIVNIGRWAALGVGSAELPTVHRLRAGAGSPMLPADAAATLIEVFEALQRLRLRYQLNQLSQAQAPSDRIERARLSPIDRSVLAQAVREIATAQRRMERVSAYLPAQEWIRGS